MKITLLISISLVAVCLGQKDHSIVRFSNGDKLSGRVIAMSLDELGWESELLRQPANFKLDELVDLEMPTKYADSTLAEAKHEAVLTMTNGDHIKGQLSGLNDDEIRLNTWYAGELSFRRVNVSSVQITRSTEVYYRGPNSIEEWTNGRGSSGWDYQAGKLETTKRGGIATEIEFSDESKISFIASWRGDFRPKLVFCSSNISTDSPDTGYEMIFQGSNVHLKRAGSNVWLGNSANAVMLREQETAKIEIRFSHERGKILLYIDDEFINLWEDDQMEEMEFGKGLHFINQNEDFLNISEIEVSSWDGYLGDIPKVANNQRGNNWRFDNQVQEVPEDDADTQDGRLILFNGDSVEGEVLGIKDEIIRLKTPFTDVSLPLIRLKNISLGQSNMETPKLYQGDVRATMADGSRLVFRLDGVEGDKLVGFSQNFGAARFHREGFKRIEFNIYNRKLEALRKNEGW